MPRISNVLTAAFAFALGVAAHAETVPVTTDGSWYSFDVDELTSASHGLEWIGLDDGSPLSFTFSGADLLLTIVDGGASGDTFHVFDNGVLLGTTSNAPDSYPSSLGLNFDAALASGNYSFATYLLAAGSHVITGELARSALDDDGLPLNATVGGLRAVSTVPLPSALLLLLSGGGLFGSLVRRRQAPQLRA